MTLSDNQSRGWRDPRVIVPASGAIIAALIGAFALIYVNRDTSDPASPGPGVTGPSLPSQAAPSPVVDSPSSTPATANIVHYLDEEQLPSQTKGCGLLEKGSYIFGGKSYDRSIANKVQQCTGGGTNYLEYDLDIGRQCSRFAVTLGMPRNEVEYARAYLEVTIDGQSVGSRVLVRNQAFDIAAPVRPASVIRLIAINRNTQYASGYPYALAVYGNARVTCQS